MIILFSASLTVPDKVPGIRHVMPFCENFGDTLLFLNASRVVKVSLKGAPRRDVDIRVALTISGCCTVFDTESK